MSAGSPNFDTSQSPEAQMVKLRESARSGGGGGGGRPGHRYNEAPLSPAAESRSDEAMRKPNSPKHSPLTLELAPDENDKDMEELLGVLHARGYDAAMRVVRSMKSPHIEDDFHRLLVRMHQDGHTIPGLPDSYKNSLDLVLYEVSVVVGDKEGANSVNDVFTQMQQFYLSFVPFVGLPDPIFFKDWRTRKAIHNDYFVMELAVQSGKEHAIFYMAVQRSKRDVFEKQVHSIFPKAEVSEAKDDYNIFNQYGSYAASEGQFINAAPLSLRHGEGFSTDPMNVTLAAFSRITKEGEGAAIQFVVMAAGTYHKGKINSAYQDIQSGKKPGDVWLARKFKLPRPYWRRFFPELWKGIQDLFKEEKKKDESKNVDAFASESVSKKLKFPIVGVNIRVVASARTEDRAKAILTDIESTFGQFDDPQGNRLKFKRFSGNDLVEFVHKFIFRIQDRGTKETKWPPYSEQPFENGLLRLNYGELAAMYHFSISGSTSSREVKSAGAKTAPAPVGLKTDGIVLGYNRHANQKTDIHFGQLDRMRHLYAIGQTGSGKTNFLKTLIKQDIENGEGVCFIDPHGPDVLDIMSSIPQHRWDDVIYFDPAYTDRPVGLNMLEYDPRFPDQKTFVVDEMFQIFKKLYGDVPEAFGPIFEQYFRNSTMLVLEDPETGSTLMDIARVLSDEDYRSLKLSRCRNPIISHFWEDVAEKVRGEGSLANIVPYITSKFDIFLANEIMRPIVGQQRSAFDFKDIMDNKKILLVNLSKGRLGEVNANLLGLILVGKIMMTALARDLSKKPPPFFLYLDEFQNITTKTISVILAEARKFGLSMTMAHQFIAQLEPRSGIKEAVFGNVGSMAVFRVGPDDSKFLETQFLPTFSASDMLQLDNYKMYLKLLSGGIPQSPFTVETYPFTPGPQENIDALRHLSYQRYGRARDVVEAEVKEKYDRMRGGGI